MRSKRQGHILKFLHSPSHPAHYAHILFSFHYLDVGARASTQTRYSCTQKLKLRANFTMMESSNVSMRIFCITNDIWKLVTCVDWWLASEFRLDINSRLSNNKRRIIHCVNSPSISFAGPIYSINFFSFFVCEVKQLPVVEIDALISIREFSVDAFVWFKNAMMKIRRGKKPNENERWNKNVVRDSKLELNTSRRVWAERDAPNAWNVKSNWVIFFVRWFVPFFLFVRAR